MTDTFTLIDEAEALLDEGQSFDARDLFAAEGPIWSWEDPALCAIGSRLANHLGAPRIAATLAFRAYRGNPKDASAFLSYVYSIGSSRGPYWAIEFTREHLAELDGPNRYLASLRANSALNWMVLRDRDNAEGELDEALALAPEEPWVHLCRGQVAEAFGDESACDEAIAQAESLNSGYRAVIEARSIRLVHTEGADAAEGYLSHHEPRAQSLSLALTRIGILATAERWTSVDALIPRLRELSQFSEQSLRDASEDIQLTTAYNLRDRGRFLRLAANTDDEQWIATCKRVEELPPGEFPAQQLLPVPAVRQKHDTCAPASLVSMARYFGQDADHDALVEQICFGGTAGYKERRWAIENGYTLREFDVNREVTRELLAAGVPFSLTTYSSTMGHVQVVVGYDHLRDALRTRDPSSVGFPSLNADDLFSSEPSTGPRGAVLLPESEARRLEDIELPRSTLWDVAFEFDEALSAHRMTAAREALKKLRKLDSEHPTTRACELSLASAEFDWQRYLELAKSLTETEPDVPRFRAWYANALNQALPWAERLPKLEAFIDDKDPALACAYVHDALNDASRRKDARRTLRRLSREAPLESEPYSQRSWLARVEGELDRSLELQRIAACLAPRNEAYALGYFRASVPRGKTEEAIKFLQRRVELAGQTSGEPARTLQAALSTLGRQQDGLAVIEDVARSLPDDALLSLACAQAHLECRQPEAALEWVERTKGKGVTEERLIVEGLIEDARGNPHGGLEKYREAVAAAPYSLRAHQLYTAALADDQGSEAAIDYVTHLLAERPHDLALVESYCLQLRSQPLRSERVLREHLQRYPEHAWARRELANILINLGRIKEALTEIEISLTWFPEDAVALASRARCMLALSRFEEARKDVLEALTLDIDAADTWTLLRDVSRSDSELVDAIDIAYETIIERGTSGEALNQLVSVIRGLRRKSITEKIEALYSRFEELPAAWLMKAMYLTDRRKFKSAKKYLAEACEQFPLSVAFYTERAYVCHLQHKPKAELAARRKAVELAPLDPLVMAALIGTLRDQGRLDEAIETGRRACLERPGVGSLRNILANTLWLRGEQEQALDQKLRALRDLPPGQPDWPQTVIWERLVGRPGATAEVARELLEAHPSSVARYLDLSLCVAGDKKIEVLEGARRQAPLDIYAADALVNAYADLRLYDKAFAICSDEAWGGVAPVPLQGTRAVLRAELGDLPGAIAELEALVAVNATYHFGWANLVSFYRRMGDLEGAERTAKRWSALNPQHIDALMMTIDCLLAKDVHRGVRPMLDRILSRAPEHTGATLVYMDVLVQRNITTELKEFLRRAEPYQPPGIMAILRAREALARYDFENALRHFGSALNHDVPDVDVKAIALQLIEKGYSHSVADNLEAALHGDEVPSVNALAAAWAEVAASLGPETGLRLSKWSEQLNRAGRIALADAMSLAIQQGEQAAMRVMNLVNEQREWLHSHTELWGSVGFVLLHRNIRLQAFQWLTDYEERADIEPWMLHNVVIAAWSEGAREIAATAAERALQLPPDAQRPFIESWAAFFRSLDGNIKGARTLLGPTPKLPQREAIARAFAATLIQAQVVSEEGSSDSVVRAVAPHLANAMAFPALSNQFVNQQTLRASLQFLKKRMSTGEYLWLRLRTFFLRIAYRLKLVREEPPLLTAGSESASST